MSFKNRFWLATALLVAFALRVYRLDAQSLWNDEGTSIALASLTGSLPQGVRRNSWALSLHVYAMPLSEMTVPKCGFASTFTQGAGVTCP